MKEQIIKEFMELLEKAVDKPFEIINEVEPGVKMETEALSSDHTIGIYCKLLPLKVREQLDGFKKIHISELLPICNNGSVEYFECIKLRKAKFRSEWLQYIEEGFDATVDEVKYPALSVLGTLHVLYNRFNNANIFLNDKVPMPLLLSPEPIREIGNGLFPAICIQAYSGTSPIPTNIHVEVSMEYARIWVPGVHTYYKKI